MLGSCGCEIDVRNEYFIAVGIEQKTGYYERQNCHHRYVPTYRQTNFEENANKLDYRGGLTRTIKTLMRL